MLETKYENITSRENLINNIKDSTCTEYFYEDDNSLNIVESLPNITNITDIQLEDNIIQFAEDFVVIDSTISKEKSTLNEKLHTWATEYNITQTSLTALLRILKEEGHNKLPSDARTLLNTPKKTIMRECENGHYFHYGLEMALRDKLKYCTNINSIDVIKININIDGLPLAKSSQSQLWPILGQICNIDIKDPFLIGAYHGYKKPTNAGDLLQEFCEEYRILHTEGFLFKNKRYLVTIKAIICDAPAKSFNRYERS